MVATDDVVPQVEVGIQALDRGVYPQPGNGHGQG
jgi:hypothetical protein